MNRGPLAQRGGHQKGQAVEGRPWVLKLILFESVAQGGAGGRWGISLEWAYRFTA